MLRLFLMGIGAVTAMCSAPLAKAGSGCNGILNSNEIAGFNTFFSPVFSPSLTTVNGDQVKTMTAGEFFTLSNSSNAPLARRVLSSQQATNLAAWLNNHATSSIPAWLSTGLGVVNSAMGLIADLALQWNSATTGDAQIAAANLAGTVTPGGLVGVVPGAAVTNGQKKYVWSYMYMADINGQSYVHVLYACQADVLIQ